ncbi:uncharacterized protein F4822DRAFT_416247 [Hypoxylon trugodes]|uniref:uncharacterized protein n=1 Tax=Hypoxylon trugodes TaxID=326681 RepID=UPI002191C696|nr:uncharacterized protein F4822DRAFT_416247 [Hypoxylon trugodes]KAI1384783.1 hypothetical protein F4822DRAFT_416247 [Hypoxylon trugodes]
MPVTEASILPSTKPGEIPKVLLDLGISGITLQGEWCATHAPWLTKDRGAALFQQIEDPGVALITAHWDSVEQHHECVASPANQKLNIELVPHIDVTKMKPGHLDGSYLFPAAEDGEGLVSAVKAPVLSVMRWAVARENKDQFGEALSKVKGTLDTLTTPYRHRGGWKIEKDGGENIEQYFIIGGLENEEKGASITEAEGYDGYYKALSSLALGAETKHYKRIA